MIVKEGESFKKGTVRWGQQSDSLRAWHGGTSLSGVLSYKEPGALIVLRTQTRRDVRGSTGITPSPQEREYLKLPPLFLEFKTDNPIPTSLAKLFLNSHHTCRMFFRLSHDCFFGTPRPHCLLLSLQEESDYPYVPSQRLQRQVWGRGSARWTEF